LNRANQGLAYVFVTLIAGAILFSILYFALMPVLSLTYAWSQTVYTNYTSQQMQSFTIIQDTLGGFALVFLFSAVIWTISNSKKRLGET